MNTQFSHSRQVSPRRPVPPPAGSRSRGLSAPTQHTRVETQYRPPLPSSRPPMLSRYTSPQDAPKAAPPPIPPSRSSGSPERVYSSPTRPFDGCRSPVMTLRILSPSRHGNRSEKRQEDQENRTAYGSTEAVPPSPGLQRYTNNKQPSPKRRRLPLRDSILLTRRDSPDFSKTGTPTNASTSRKPPPSLRQQRSSSETLEISSMPSTPPKSRLPELPRFGVRLRDHPPNVPQPPTPPARLPPRETNLENCQAATKDSVDSPMGDEKRLVSRICSMILYEEFGAGVDRSSTPLKVWDTVAKCLDGISRLTQPGPSGENVDAAPPECLTSGSRQPLEAPSQIDTGSDADNNTHGPSTERTATKPYNGLVRDRLSDSHTENVHSRTDSLPCPYRLRNPARFNVNDKWQCATGKWNTLSELQTHVVKDHQKYGNAHLFQCPRCEKGFPEPAAFKEHLMLPREQMCEPRSEVASPDADADDGLTAARARDLCVKIANGSVKSWDDLWRWLFPSDKMVPRPVVLPAVELPQVEQEVFASSNMSNLKASLEERLRFLASQSANTDSLSAQIPVITASLSLVVEAHLRSVFICCRNQPPGHSRKSLPKQNTATGRPRNLSSASTSSARSLERIDHRGPAISVNDVKGLAKVTPRAPGHRQRSNSEESGLDDSSRAANLPVPTMLTIPFPRISAMTEQSDVGPSPSSEGGNGSPKNRSSDAEYSSGVDSSPSSAGGFRESNTTDIRCSKCNMRPSLRPDEDVFSDAHFRERSSAARTQDPTCRFSDSGIGILCKSCRMLEELINSYSRTSSRSAKSGSRSHVSSGVPETKDVAHPAPPFSPNLSVSVDESEEETLFDLILDSATYLDEEGNRKTEIVSPMFPPQVGFPKYDRFPRDDNFF